MALRSSKLYANYVLLAWASYAPEVAMVMIMPPPASQLLHLCDAGDTAEFIACSNCNMSCRDASAVETYAALFAAVVVNLFFSWCQVLPFRMQRSRWFKFRLLHAAESEAMSCEHLVWDVGVYVGLLKNMGQNVMLSSATRLYILYASQILALCTSETSQIWLMCGYGGLAPTTS